MRGRQILVALGLVSALSTFAVEPSDAPWDLSIYSLEDIGKEGRGFSGGNTRGKIGSRGDAYFSGYSIDAGQSLSTWPQAAFIGGDLHYSSGSINNGDLEVGGNLYLYSIGYSDTIHSGGSLYGGRGTLGGDVYLSGSNQSSLSITGDVFTQQAYLPSFNHMTAARLMQGASNYWGSLSPTATWVNQWGKIQVGNLTSGRNIVDISLDDLANVWGIGLNGPSDAYVIFNITDATVANDDVLRSVSFQLSGGMGMEDILFNLTNAETLTLQSGNYASILAPRADLNLASSTIIGNLVGQNIYGRGSARDASFAGYMVDEQYFAASAPEPATWLVLFTLLGLVFYFLGMKRKMCQLNYVYRE